MLKSTKIKLTILISATFFLSQCKNDFKVNDEWKDIAVIYGLLSSSDSINYIRVSKAFLGDGDSYAMAQVSDSLYYQNTTVKIEERINGNLTNTYNCLRIDTFREPGIFAHNNIIFATNAVLLNNPDTKYKLLVFANNKEITAETALIQDFPVYPINPIVQLSSSTNKLSITWSTPPIGKIYEPVVRFFYYDITSTDTTKKYLDITLDSQLSTSKEGGEVMSTSLIGTAFLHTVANIMPNNQNLIKRIVAKGSLEIRISVGSDEMYSYMQATLPTSEMVTDKPNFSNINNGLGLFSTRFIKIVPVLPSLRFSLSQNTIDSLALGKVNGPNGRNLKFIKYSPDTYVAWTSTLFP